MAINFQEGTVVRKGELLAKVNDLPLVAQLSRYEAQLKLAEDRVYRQSALLKKDAVSQEAYEQARTELAMLNAIDIVKSNIALTELRAPFDGVIGLRNVSEGAYASPSVVVAKLTKISPLKIDFFVPERYANQIKHGTRLSFTIEGRQERFEAAVYATESKVDIATRTLAVRAKYPNTQGKLLPGRFATVQIRMHEIPDAIAIPTEALVPEMGVDKVFLYKGGKAHAAEVKTGLRTDSSIQIIDGLNVGDTLITSGTLQLREGLPVKSRHRRINPPPHEHFRTEHPEARPGVGADDHHPAIRSDRIQLPRRARIPERRQPDHLGLVLLPGRQRRRDRKPDHRAARTEHQWHPGHPLAVERQQSGPEPHHRRVRISVDLETAANDVRDKVSRAQRYLPRDCDPPTVTKADADASPILMVTIQSDKRSLLELSEIADLTVKEQLQTISDVSGVQIWGEKRYSMRLWLDPAKMAGYGITPTDIKTALDRENVELPSGSIEGNTTELTIRTMGLMHTTREFNDLVVREDADRIIRMSDVGRAELGPQDTRSYMKMNGIPMVGVVVIPQPGANHIEIADAVYARMESMKKDLPDDVVTSYGFDNTRFIRASIDEVRTTVYEAFILVIIIIFLFLRNWRVTLIPCIVIPVSLIGTFFVMYAAGFSINVLSMLAVVLSVGLVVDDAIVMTENIYIRIERGMTPFDAGIEGAKEIFFAVISTSITLIAVFFPIVFMEGMTGRLFREFSMVISGAVVISTFAALTITPMLATKLLVRQEKKSWFYSKTEPFFVWLNDFYSRTLASFLRRRWLALPLVLLTMGLIGWLWSAIPAEMAPLEDRSQISINTRGSEGATYEYIRDYTEDINRLVDSLVPEASSVTARVSSGSGNVRIALTDIATRKRSQMEIAEQISAAVRSKTKARAFVQQQSTFGGRRGRMPVQYVLQATSLERLQEVLPEFMRKVYESPVFQMADVDLKFSKPEVRIEVNRDKANLLGVSTRNIAQTLQYGLSGQRLGYFYMNGKQYEILAEINRQQRNKPADLRSIYVRSDKGEMIQMDNLISRSRRTSRRRSSTITTASSVGHRVGRTGWARPSGRDSTKWTASPTRRSATTSARRWPATRRSSGRNLSSRCSPSSWPSC